MTTEQIESLGPALAEYLAEFADCFSRREPRGKLEVYVRGQLSELPRKSVEPIALAADLKPRTLQEFLASDEWREDGVRTHIARLLVRDHADDQAIGVIDESGHPKKGDETAGVSRQYCGRTGKIDNCVMSVHLTYTSFDGEFRTMMDSDLYLPQSWHDDRDRCRRAKIPDEVVYRPKYEIALKQLDRAAAAGVAFRWITADEWYAQKPRFVAGLEARGLRFVLEIPRNFACWLHAPAEGQQPKAAENLCRYSRALQCQPWQPFHIKDTDKGPMVWEVKAAPCWLPREGSVIGPYWLIVARNVLHPEELKYFVSNAAAGVPLEAILHVAFSRWSVERCLQDEKSELGLSHFEVRCYPALKRHLLLTQVSHLFLARETQRLREKKSGDHLAADAPRGQHPPGRPRLAAGGAAKTFEARGPQADLLATTERACPNLPPPHHTQATRTTRNSSPTPTPLQTRLTAEHAL